MFKNDAIFGYQNNCRVEIKRKGSLIAEILTVSVYLTVRDMAPIYIMGPEKICMKTREPSQLMLAGYLTLCGGQLLEVGIAPWDMYISGKYNFMIPNCEIIYDKNVEVNESSIRRQRLWFGPKSYPKETEKLICRIVRETN